MNSVIKGTGYVLVHVPDMVLLNGTTQSTERIVNPDSEYLKEIKGHMRSYDDALSYWPNQIYIGNGHPEDLRKIEFPYFNTKKENSERYGKFGEIMDLEDGVKALWKAGIYAESGMGCTGPVILMAEANKEKATEILTKAGYIS